MTCWYVWQSQLNTTTRDPNPVVVPVLTFSPMSGIVWGVEGVGIFEQILADLGRPVKASTGFIIKNFPSPESSGQDQQELEAGLADPRRRFLVSWFNLSLLFLPLAVVLEIATADPLFIFAASAPAIIPLAGWLSRATEHLTTHVGKVSEVSVMIP